MNQNPDDNIVLDEFRIPKKNRILTPDEFIDFVISYNKFINFKPKKFKKIIDKYMVL